MAEKKEKVGFFKTLKSNPQTVAEAKKKTRALIGLCAIIFGAFVVLFFFLHYLIALIWAVVAAGILLYLSVTWNQQTKRNFCSDCGTRFDYEDGVSWEVTNVETKTMNTNSNSQSKQIYEKEVATVAFTCRCLNCGSEKNFTNKFDVTLWYTDGTRRDFNIETAAKKYFKI